MLAALGNSAKYRPHIGAALERGRDEAFVNRQRWR
jgi:hypothetical protein